MPLAIIYIACGVLIFRWVGTAHGWWGPFHSAAPQDAFSQSQDPFNPVVVGTGGDLVTGQLPGHAPISVTGTLHGNVMTPSDSRIPAFNVPAQHIKNGDIPTPILQLLVKLGLYK